MSLRQPKPWEICLHDKSMTGIHLWHIEERLIFNENTGRVKAKDKKQSIVVCKTCKQQPPRVHRGKIYEKIKEQLASEKEARRIRNLYRPWSRRR